MNQYVSIRMFLPRYGEYRTILRRLFQGVPRVGDTIEFDGEDRSVTDVHWQENTDGVYRPTVTLR